jgi:hypothetical protein
MPLQPEINRWYMYELSVTTPFRFRPSLRPHYPIRPKNDLQLQVKDKRFVVLCRTPEHLAVYLQKIASLLGIVSATQHVRNSSIRPDVAGVLSLDCYEFLYLYMSDPGDPEVSLPTLLTVPAGTVKQ